MKKLLKSKPALIAIAVCVLLLGIGSASGSDNQELKDQLAQGHSRAKHGNLPK